MKLSDNQVMKISSLLRSGITFSFPDEETIVIKQEKIVNCKIFSNKQLYSLAREIFPEHKIVPAVFSLNLESITIEWVSKQMRLYGINAKDLQRQLGFEKEVINDFIKTIRKSSSVLLFYYF